MGNSSDFSEREKSWLCKEQYSMPTSVFKRLGRLIKKAHMSLKSLSDNTNYVICAVPRSTEQDFSRH